MIGNPRWFEIRKYGWGLKPKTWQGWVYVVANTIIPLLFLLLPISANAKMTLVGIWLLITLIDSTDIMIRMQKDEREIINEALAERNVSWFVIFSLTAIIVYQIIQSMFLQNSMINIPIITIVFGALIIKALTYWHLDK